jgi:two-component system, LytTR family, sensor kinase
MTQQALPSDRIGRHVRWWQALAFWTLVVLVSSTRSPLRTGAASWDQALRLSLAFWSVWALLCPLILRFDRSLPLERWVPASRDQLSKRLPRKRLLLRLLLHLPASLAFTLVHAWLGYAISALLQTPFSPSPFDLDPLTLLRHLATGLSILVYWGIIGIAIAFDYQRHAADRRIKALELEKLLAESRFDTLRTRLHPHVLFNALNAISAHVETDPRQARWILEQFGSMLRLSLEHDREPEIPLERELAYVECYLDLQKVRFEDRFEVITKVDPDVLDAYVPTFILQPLVENALRHGVLTRSSPGQILIEACREDGSLRLSVRDDGPGLPDGWDAAGGSGVGLTNTRERLHRLYGKDQSLDIAAAPGSGVHVALTLPFRKTRGLRSGSSDAHPESAWHSAVGVSGKG